MLPENIMTKDIMMEAVKKTLVDGQEKEQDSG